VLNRVAFSKVARMTERIVLLRGQIPLVSGPPAKTLGSRGKDHWRIKDDFLQFVASRGTSL
jgi:hypothetical protein